MATRRERFLSVVGSAGFSIGVILMLPPSGVLEAGTLVNLAWDANTESDLAGYRIHYGTSSGSYTLPTINLGQVTSYSIANLTANTNYYLVVTAYDFAGNESLPSNEVVAQPTATIGPSPTVASAVEIDTGSIYILQSGVQTIQVNGTNFQSGAIVSLSADITVGRTSLTGTTLLTVPITVSPTASLGPRSVTVTNPDGGSGSRPNTMTVVETADIDRDCKIDVGDLNILARAWNTATSESAYIAAADLDGDGYVGPIDLAIFVEYLGQMLAVCP